MDLVEDVVSLMMVMAVINFSLMVLKIFMKKCFVDFIVGLSVALNV